MDPEKAQKHFMDLCRSEPHTSIAVVAIRTLRDVIAAASHVETVQELRAVLLATIDAVRRTDTAVASVRSACELFLRFITLTTLDRPDFADCKRALLERADEFLRRVGGLRASIARRALPFLQDGARILVHSRSRTVLHALQHAVTAGRSFSCLVMEGRPGGKGADMARELAALGVSARLVVDAAVGVVMEQVDLVLLGAEAVLESGGIVNKMGSYTLGLCARAHNRPVYVLAESFKFLREYPLSQADLKDDVKHAYSTLQRCAKEQAAAGPERDLLAEEDPLVDYTPPELLTLLFTDLGTLTPSAVSDELIKLYL